ncbi:MAG TPA: hypothetical protein PKD53_11775 [Chloroflexaceae bacterium]|nr:hypothetical protein [Chloroflexaceae bacterium]
MRAPYTTTNSTQIVFGWLVAQEARLHRRFQLMSARRDLARAFARFAAAYPRMAHSLFDAHFVETRVAPLLARAYETGAPLRPEAVAAAWVEACRGPEADAGCYDLTAITVAARELLDCLDAERRLAPKAEAAPWEDNGALFAEAVRANSNLELDWLWLAARVRDEEQRRFCYQKALHINPACEEAWRALAAMAPARARAPELTLREA